jgi:hypothetical protein
MKYQLLIDLFNPSSPEMQEAMQFKYPCGLYGYEIEEKPLDFCNKCHINTNDCMDYWVNANPLDWRRCGPPPTFEQYLRNRNLDKRCADI